MQYSTEQHKNPHAQALGKLGRSRNTAAQQEAAKRNGAKGGRPAKRLPSAATSAK